MILDKVKEVLTRPDVGSSRVLDAARSAQSTTASGPTVMHVVRTYLRFTENWIYAQVQHLERHRSVFAAKRVVNLPTFPFEPLYSLTHARLYVRLLDKPIEKRTGYSPFFSAVAERERASIIHAHGGGTATLVMEAARRAGVPLVISFYGHDMWNNRDGDAGLRRKYERVFRCANLVLAEGPAAAAQLVRIGCPEDRVAIHRLGVDVAEIPFKSRFLADGSKLKVFMASRFVEKKGIPYGVEGFCRVARDNPRMRLTIVGDSGSAKDSHMRKQFEDIAERHGVRAQVTILPFMGRQELRDLAEQHQVLLHPSVRASTGDSEGGHPVVMTMLAASGMPILATRHCDIPEVVKDNETGWLVSERNADEIEATLRSIVRDPSMLAEFGSAGRRLVETKYDIRALRLDSVYDRVLPGG